VNAQRRQRLVCAYIVMAKPDVARRRCSAWLWRGTRRGARRAGDRSPRHYHAFSLLCLARCGDACFLHPAACLRACRRKSWRARIRGYLPSRDAAHSTCDGGDAGSVALATPLASALFSCAARCCWRFARRWTFHLCMHFWSYFSSAAGLVLRCHTACHAAAGRALQAGGGGVTSRCLAAAGQRVILPVRQRTAACGKHQQVCVPLVSRTSKRQQRASLLLPMP